MSAAAGARPEPQPVDLLVDWELAVRTAGLLVQPGPELGRREVRAAVAQLRRHAAASQRHVAEVARLEVPSDGDVLVVDRPGWVQANVDSFRELLAPVVARAWERRAREKQPSALVAAIGRRATGAEVGALLSFLSSRVLGQYDAFRGLDGDAPLRGRDRSGGGRLLLVAPNVVHVERELGVVPSDFRLWVCLHEETHRVQFGAAPWLRDHLAGEVRSLVDDLLGEPGQAVERLVGGLRQLPGVLRGDSETGLVDLVQTPEQRARMEAVTAAMSLLEGHADVVMDDVGPRVVPTVGQIRERFSRRRQHGTGPVDVLLRRLLGLEAKARQYRDGAAFVRGVQQRVGVDGLNAVWSGPDALPSPAELHDPAAWVARVHG